MNVSSIFLLLNPSPDILLDDDGLQLPDNLGMLLPGQITPPARLQQKNHHLCSDKLKNVKKTSLKKIEYEEINFYLGILTSK